MITPTAQTFTRGPLPRRPARPACPLPFPALLLGLAISAATGWLVASSLSWMAWAIVLSALLILAGDSFLSLRDVSSATSVGGRGQR